MGRGEGKGTALSTERPAGMELSKGSLRFPAGNGAQAGGESGRPHGWVGVEADLRADTRHVRRRPPRETRPLPPCTSRERGGYCAERGRKSRDGGTFPGLLGCDRTRRLPHGPLDGRRSKNRWLRTDSGELERRTSRSCGTKSPENRLPPPPPVPSKESPHHAVSPCSGALPKPFYFGGAQHQVSQG